MMSLNLSVQDRYQERMKNQPREVVYCQKCVISNQRPRIRFDENSVCSACNYAEKKHHQIDWNAREDEFRVFLDAYRSKKGDYDVIVPCSGGKDSSSVAHQLKTKYGMHPLTVTFSPLMYTDNGWGNIQRFIRSGFDNILFTPNGEVYRRMCRLGFEVMGDPFQPFIYGVKAFPLQMALQYDIPLIMYAENGEVEYGGDDKNEDSPFHDTGEDLVKHYFSGITPEDWVDFGIKGEDLTPFLPPESKKLQALGIRCLFFGYYNKWIPQENYYYAAEHTGFQPNPDGRSEGTYSKYASLDDRMDGIHYYMAYIKFGIGRTTSDAAHEIRDGHLTREDGVALVHRFDGEFPHKYFKEFLEYTDLTELKFQEIVDSFRLPHIWMNENGVWKLKHQVS
jgi:N-acetyl sugar amidotransferase